MNEIQLFIILNLTIIRIQKNKNNDKLKKNKKSSPE